MLLKFTLVSNILFSCYSLPDLFDQVIAQSGSELAFWALNSPGQYPGNYTRQVAEKHNCIRETSEDMMNCMREIDWDTLRRSQGITCVVSS